MQCPMCGSPAETVFRRQNQLGSVYLPPGQRVDLHVGGCRNCDFFWNVDAFADPAAFTAWVTPAYQSYRLLDNDLHGFPLVDPRSVTAADFLDVHCPWQDMRHVLEVGSNRGDFLAYLQQRHGYLQLLGVESSPLSLVGVPTLFHDVHDLRFSASFDLVVARQVLEHMADPVRFLSRLASFLRPGAWLMVEVPELETELDEGVDPWVVEHVGHYSGQALELLGRRVGLSLEALDRTYQMSALFRKVDCPVQRPDTLGQVPGHGRWERVSAFCDLVGKRQAQWREWAAAGNEICFYGASNVFLAMSAVLRERWGEAFWKQCRLALIDDYSGKHGSVLEGLRVQSLDEYRPSGPTAYVVCAMYRYHRQKMTPKVGRRLRPGDQLYEMWTASPR